MDLQRPLHQHLGNEKLQLRRGGGPRLVLYDGANYSGEARDFGPGRFDLTSTWDNRAESMTIPNGWSARLYLDGAPNFAGQSVCFDQSMASLPGSYPNNVSAVDVFTNSNCYDSSIPPQINYCGAVILWGEGGDQLVLTSSSSNLGDQNWYNHARYIEVIGNYVATAYDGENFQSPSHGPYDDGAFWDIGTNIKSVRIEPNGNVISIPDYAPLAASPESCSFSITIVVSSLGLLPARSILPSTV